MRSMRLLLWRKNAPPSFAYAYFYSYACAECMLAVEFSLGAGPGH